MKLGRMGRRSYFLVLIVYAVLFVLLFSTPFAGLSFIVNLLFIPFMIKRLHDLGSTGWLAVIMIIPMIGLILSGALVFQAGENRTNKYGPPPSS